MALNTRESTFVLLPDEGAFFMRRGGEFSKMFRELFAQWENVKFVLYV